MKRQKILPCVALIILSLLAFACTRNECPVPAIVKSDALSNTIWLGAYGEKKSDYTYYDTTFIFMFKAEGFISVFTDKSFYHANADSILKIYKDLPNRTPDGKGLYTFDGTTFDAIVVIDRIGTPYSLHGTLNENKTMILGGLNFNPSNPNGVFFIKPDYLVVK